MARAAAVSPSARACPCIDVIEGTLAKAFGMLGITSPARAPSSTPCALCAGLHLHHRPAASIAAAATASIRHLEVSQSEREAQQRRRRAPGRAVGRRLPGHAVVTHIAAAVGDRVVQDGERSPLGKHGIYIQPINYPTVPRGTERLRITPTPFHSDALIDGLRDALIETWDSLGIPYGAAGQPAVVKSDRIVPLLVPKSGGYEAAAAARFPFLRVVLWHAQRTYSPSSWHIAFFVILWQAQRSGARS